MSNVIVPFEGKAEERATLLLAAAEESKEFGVASVRTISGAFLVPEEIAKSADLSYERQESPDLRTREADVPGETDTVETHRMGAGPTGEVSSNVDFDRAETGTVQNQRGEQEMGEPRSDPPAKKGRRRQAAKKSQASQEESPAEEKQE